MFENAANTCCHAMFVIAGTVTGLCLLAFACVMPRDGWPRDPGRDSRSRRAAPLLLLGVGYVGLSVAVSAGYESLVEPSDLLRTGCLLLAGVAMISLAPFALRRAASGRAKGNSIGPSPSGRHDD